MPVKRKTPQCPHAVSCSSSTLTIERMDSLPVSYKREGRKQNVFHSAIYELIKDFPWIRFRGIPCVANAFLLNTQLTLSNSSTVSLKQSVIAAMTKGGETDAAAIESRYEFVYQGSCTVGFLGKLKENNNLFETYAQRWQLSDRSRISLVSANGVIYYLQNVFRNKIWLAYRDSLYSEVAEEPSYGFSDSDTDSGANSDLQEDEQGEEEKRPDRIPAVVPPGSIEVVNIARLRQIFDVAVLLDSIRLRHLIEDLIGFYNHRYTSPMPINIEDISVRCSKHTLADSDARLISMTSRAKPIKNSKYKMANSKEYHITTTVPSTGGPENAVNKHMSKTGKRQPSRETTVRRPAVKKARPASSTFQTAPSSSSSSYSSSSSSVFPRSFQHSPFPANTNQNTDMPITTLVPKRNPKKKPEDTPKPAVNALFRLQQLNHSGVGTEEEKQKERDQILRDWSSRH